MRKEIIIAIFVGIFVGLAVAFGVWRANTALKTADQPPIAIPGTSNEQKEEQPRGGSGIVLSQPEDLDIVSDKKVEIKGITKPNSLVIISAEENDYIIRTDQNGEFSQVISLIGGINEIQLEAYDPKMQKSNTVINIVYSEGFEDS